MKRILKFIIAAALVWGACYFANVTLNTIAHNNLLGGDLRKARSKIKFTIPFEPLYYIHRARMGRETLFAAFDETDRLMRTRLRWVMQTGAPVLSSPLLWEDTVYVGNNGKKLFKLNAGNGKLIWTYEAGGSFETKPLLAGGLLFAAAHDGLHAIDPETGSRAWFYKSRWAESSPAFFKGMVLMGEDDGKMTALDAKTGKVRWQYGTAGPVESAPAAAGGRVYFGCNRGMIYAVDAARGYEVWTHPVKGRIEGSPLVVDGAVVAGCTGGTVYAFDAELGTLLWEKELGGSIEGGAAGDGKKIIVGTKKGRVFALSGADGAIIWMNEETGPVETTPAIYGDTVYIGCHYGFLTALDISTGARKWRFLTGWDIDESSPETGPDSIFIGSTDGRIYSIGIDREETDIE